MSPRQQNQDTHSNKEKAVSFLQLVSSGKVREAFRSYIGPGFCHHNPFFPGDSDSLMIAMEENALKNPDKTLEVKRAIEEEDRVVIHSHIKQNPEDLGMSVVHIFRFQGNQIVEVWDVAQPIPHNSPNENGAF
ncbi:nuclear transport factor 2 family protein [Guptibacillus hwajinpoensis]|uniref:nuclear transport factor 2 family protein n=1 Tax=Guptibacillus hwajinpoensis TaxID=208199 RepID=UPI001CFDE7F1|nr:ester cyclase [Pseudalkalibacillus hwajinpoensis]